MTETEIIKSMVVDVEETEKYFLDKKNICKEVIHVINTSKSSRIRLCVFKKINSENTMDLGVFERYESEMVSIPNCVVEKMHIT